MLRISLWLVKSSPKIPYESNFNTSSSTFRERSISLRIVYLFALHAISKSDGYENAKTNKAEGRNHTRGAKNCVSNSSPRLRARISNSCIAFQTSVVLPALFSIGSFETLASVKRFRNDRGTRDLEKVLVYSANAGQNTEQQISNRWRGFLE